jgi:hypothetical protein
MASTDRKNLFCFFVDGAVDDGKQAVHSAGIDTPPDGADDMTTFQIGRTYTGRFIGDADAIISLTVLKRTALTITAESADFQTGAKVKSLRIKTSHTGAEYVLPLGSYSMAPSISAS